MAFYPHWDNAFAQRKPMVPAFYITFLQVWQKMYLKFLSSGNYVLDSYIECELRYKKSKYIKILFVKFISVNINFIL